MGGAGGPLEGRVEGSGRRREWFDRTGEFYGLEDFRNRSDRRFARCKSCMREQEGERRDRGAVGGLAAGHCAGHEAGHLVAAVHFVRGAGRRFLVMMGSYGAVVAGAAGHGVGGPEGGGQWGVEESYGQHAEAGGDCPSVLMATPSHYPFHFWRV